MLHKGVIVELGHPDRLTLSVQPLVRHCPTIIECLDTGCQQLHGWFTTKGRAIKAAKAICHNNALLVQTELSDNLTRLNELE